MRLVPIECVRPNVVLAKSIYDNNGMIMLKKGAVLNSQVISKIQELDIWSIYIEDEYSSVEIEDVIKPEVRQKAVNFLKEAFTSIEKMFRSQVKFGDKKSEVIQRQNMEYILSIEKIADELINNILSNKKVLLGLVDIKSFDNYLYQHSINVTVILLAIGVSLKYQKDDLQTLALGALMHDIGKALIPIDVVKKQGKLTEEEKRVYNLHTKRGYEYVKDHLMLKQDSNLIVLQHHERIDGKGYPNGTDGDKITMMSKIVTIADTYDYLTSDTLHTRAIQAADALEFIMAHVNSLFDYDLVRVFSKILIAYPTGTIVKLSNGEVAVVEGTPANYPLRPNLKIIKSKVKDRIGKSISLLKELSLVINNVEFNV